MEDFFDRLSKSSSFPYVKKFKAPERYEIPKAKYSRILGVLENTLENTDYKFLGGLSIFTFSGIQLVVVARNNPIAQDFVITEQIVSDLNSEVFFGSLPNKVEKEGLGYMKFDYFEKYFAQIIEGFAVAYQVIEQDKRLEKRLNNLTKDLAKLLEDIDQTPTIDVEEEEEFLEEAEKEPELEEEPQTVSPTLEISDMQVHKSETTEEISEKSLAKSDMDTPKSPPAEPTLTEAANTEPPIDEVLIPTEQPVHSEVEMGFSEEEIVEGYSDNYFEFEDEDIYIDPETGEIIITEKKKQN